MHTERPFSLRDQVTVQTYSAIPPNPIAMIVFIHGLGEHIGRYRHYFDFFNDHDIACHGFDLRGHGKSEGKRGHVKSYDDLLDDIEEILAYLENTFPDIPLFLYGHSLGGNIGLNYLIRKNPANIKAAVITSPWVRLRFRPSSLKILLATIMHHISPSYTDKNDLDPRHLSHDPDVQKEYENDPLVHDKISAGLFIKASNAGQYVLDHARDLRIPVLLIHGTEDPITSPDASRELASLVPDFITFRSHEGMLHETHNEIGKQEIYNETCAWFKSHL